MKNLKQFGIALSIFVLTGFNGYSQYTGPQTKVALTTVKNVMANASALDKSDALVKLEGYIIEHIREDEFWFKDETGKVLVEIEKKHFPTFEFNEKTKVIIVGEVDYDLLEGTEIEVDSITLKK